MKKLLIYMLISVLCLGICGCLDTNEHKQIVATTLPVYEFTMRICQGTELAVSRLITENISCLHDYTLQTRHMRMLESATLILSTGTETDIFLNDICLDDKKLVDTSAGVPLLHCENTSEHAHDDHRHNDEYDHHIWLSPANAKIMAKNICHALCEQYPQHKKTFEQNFNGLTSDLHALEVYGNETLKPLTERKLITFHDGFTYLADAFDLQILKAIEEESGSEASAGELIALIQLISSESINAIFTERNGSDASAQIIAGETDATIFQLDMAMSGDSYFDAMYTNINTLKEALE